MMAVPMYVLYEAGIIMSRLLVPKRPAEAADGADEEGTGAR
jgi:Sec-independent protein secretion pathway component TatC